MKTDLTFLKPLVAQVMTDPLKAWTVQGFGFLRTYFGPADNPKRYRLNLWSSRFTVPNVSTIHDHPWDFKSIIIAGAFCNVRYDADDGYRDCFPTHRYTTIKTGEAGGLTKIGDTLTVLTAQRPELYTPGDVYKQSAHEIHETIFVDGTVTLNERVGDTQHARVFWPAGAEWVDAMPREAYDGEVKDAVSRSLKEWF
jgi:hypothetical protein